MSRLDLATVFLALCAAAALGACARLGWGRHPASAPSPEPRTLGVGASSGAPRARPEELPQVDVSTRDVRYYADLGPDWIDVSDYPAQQKYNYSVYAEACSRCHTLARSVNSPVASRAFWDMYMLGMRAAGKLKGKPAITKQERKAILDFLDYDSKVRKIEHEREFAARTEELKRRYEPYLKERLRRLQQSRGLTVPDQR